MAFTGSNVPPYKRLVKELSKKSHEILVNKKAERMTKSELE